MIHRLYIQLINRAFLITIPSFTSFFSSLFPTEQLEIRAGSCDGGPNDFYRRQALPVSDSITQLTPGLNCTVICVLLHVSQLKPGLNCTVICVSLHVSQLKPGLNCTVICVLLHVSQLKSGLNCTVTCVLLTVFHLRPGPSCTITWDENRRYAHIQLFVNAKRTDCDFGV